MSKEEIVFKAPFYTIEDIGWIWDANDAHVLDVRGWGYLCGTGGLNLQEDVATKKQDEFKEHVVVCLNNHNALVEALEGLRDTIQETRGPDAHAALENAEKLLDKLTKE